MPITNPMKIGQIDNIQPQQPIGIINELKLRVSKDPNKVIIEWADSELLALYASIQLYEYAKNPTFPHGSPHDNFIGLIGELSVREILKTKGIWPQYAARKLNYWADGKADQRPFDFKLDNGKTIEIITLKPNSYFAEIKDTAWKRSNYAIAVKINWLKCYVELFNGDKYQTYEMNETCEVSQPIDSFKEEPTVNQKQIGEAEIIGYDTLETIQKAPITPIDETIIEPNSGWFYSALNQKIKCVDGYRGSITPIADARCIRIKPRSQLLNIDNLWKQIGV
jgi:hypothetical protein